MQGYHTAVFDLDGTLLNTLEDLADAANFALLQMGWPTRSQDEIRSFVGNGVELLIRRAAPHRVQEAEISRCLSVFKEHYAAHMAYKTAPYPGILPLLRALRQRGVTLAVVSNKFDSAVKELCAGCFPGLIQAAVGASDQASKKPDPAMVVQAFRALGTSPAGAVYIGDSDVDLQTARNAGLPCLSVTWGFRDAAFLRTHGAAVLVHRPEELLSFFPLPGFTPEDSAL